MDSGPPPIPAGVEIGQILAGKYRVEHILGVGGMGVVVAAHHLQLDEKVALKFLLPDALKNAEAVARFLREARAAVKIKSEHVAHVSDVGTLESGSPYMVMEYLDGGDLSSWLEQRGAMSVEQAVDFILQACEAIGEAHALGIIHRDLKPANLFCVQRADGQLSVKVLDFGISKVTKSGAEGHDMTSTAAIIGSPNYMSPEQLQSSKGVDARTDIWALGVILFELLTARTPFAAETLTELIIQIATAPAPDVRAYRPDTPPPLAQIVAGCLEKDRTKRFADVGELAQALEPFGSKRAYSSVERVLGTLRKAGIATGEQPSPARMSLVDAHATGAISGARTNATWGNTGAPAVPKRKTGLWVGLGVGGVALVGAIAGGISVSKRSATTPAASPLPSAATALASASSAADVPSAATAVTLSPEPSATGSGAAPSAVPASPHAPSSSVHRATTTALPRPGHGTQGGSPTPAANCNPNYTLDDQGQKHFKPECFVH